MSDLNGRQLQAPQEQSCPVFAVGPDIDGDCRCLESQPNCFQDSRQQCFRADGRLDLHYFAVSCETCMCQSSIGDSSSNGESEITCATADGAQEVTLAPDAAGLCYCPDSLPHCVLLPDELEGCVESQTAETVLTEAFPAGCVAERCACRAPCPSFAQKRFADPLGDCACPTSTPLCYEDGVQGCTSATGTTSKAYFASSCGSHCECIQQFNYQCDARTCFASTDCIFSTCRDCDICKGITRCPTPPGDDTVSLPDWSGNCRCPNQQVCFEGGSRSPGCPIAPSGRSQFSFQVTCVDCICGEQTGSSGNVKCPKFARDNVPGFSGDCICPDELPDCYQDGVKWCLRTDGQRDLHYFDPGCLDCDCRAATQRNGTDEQVKPCPSFAKFSESSSYQNCLCPDDLPVCIQQDGAAAPGRAGPYCRVAQGWDSSREFRYDCTTCSCVGIDGEGLQLRDFAPEELLTAAGVTYVRMNLAFDIRLVNTDNSLNDWSLVSDRVLLSESSRQVIADAAAFAITGQGHSVMGYCNDLTDVTSRTVNGGDYEGIRIHRLFAELGVMFAEGSGRRLAIRDSEDPTQLHHSRSLQSVKAVDQLTLQEHELLLSLSTVFRPMQFKQQLDVQMQLLLDDMASWHPSPGLVQPPRFSVSRAQLGDLQDLPTLEITGPLARSPPVTNNMKDAPDVGTSSEPTQGDLPQDEGIDLMSLLPVGISVVSLLVALPLLYCCLRRFRRCLRRRREKRRSKSSDGSRSPRSPRSPTGSPRSPRPASPRSPRGSPRNVASPRSPKQGVRETRETPDPTESKASQNPEEVTATTSFKPTNSMRVVQQATTSVFDKKKPNESAVGDLAIRQKLGQKSTSAAASSALAETESDENKGKRGFMGRMRRKDKEKDQKEKGGSPNQSPRAADRSPRSPR